MSTQDNRPAPTGELEVTPVRMPDPAVREHKAWGPNGFVGLLVGLVLVGLGIAGIAAGTGLLIGLGIAALVLGAVTLRGLTTVAPGEAKVVQFFGRYVGTVRTSGLRWVNPLTSRRKISTRIRNHESEVLKVNDLDGNPIEIAAVVVWQVEDTARAVFEVDSFVAFVHTQTETAIRHIATSYAYDSHEEDLSLRQNAEEITERLSREIGDRVDAAGVTIVESRLTHLAYAPEIAGAMLQRQQAGAVVAARGRIVEGAVGMVEMALERLSEREIVALDEERKAAMVSNLMVVLCGDRATQPIVNAGSLYH
ncbi:membrane protein [Pseudonocardia sulfidoxydans NBRC 16205]|uniref:Membrane protein n=1 Tax=Pseudonocardia sulfidoxydans NBRC 16205 TaxID=1223511 RepID=A0A511DSL7_9PSEU|nr:SPFH domain-containing protein [Pseudonocardia sulfidoxydans]GEL26744.1 membrane protein [Pseudonocardia sulfidoxydans NBRC 16205]